ncbi:hypothetical protein RAH41_11605 [Gottfriedia acidiceleris]|uniref:hypothetical protein n=1 Tax=Gottfriedia acidiceleris TaxID=371036 RepID=UPI002F269AC6
MITESKFFDKIKLDLIDHEELQIIVEGRTVPSSPTLIFLPEISWLTKENMQVVLAFTSQRIIVYKIHLNQSLSLALDINKSAIKSVTESSGPLNGGIKLTLDTKKSYKFIFKKERVKKIKHFLSEQYGLNF